MRYCTDCGEDTRRLTCPECGHQTWDEEEDAEVLDLLFRHQRGEALILGIVGESHYQPNLKAILKASGRACRVVLRLEPDNPHDPNAVQVREKVSGAVFGYLERRLAKQYRDTIATIPDRDYLAALKGGFRGRPSIGVMFDATDLRKTYEDREPRASKTFTQPDPPPAASPPAPSPAAAAPAGRAGCASVIALALVVAASIVLGVL